jgi:hypothetical protein
MRCCHVCIDMSSPLHPISTRSCLPVDTGRFSQALQHRAQKTVIVCLLLECIEFSPQITDFLSSDGVSSKVFHNFFKSSCLSCVLFCCRNIVRWSNVPNKSFCKIMHDGHLYQLALVIFRPCCRQRQDSHPVHVVSDAFRICNTTSNPASAWCLLQAKPFFVYFSSRSQACSLDGIRAQLLCDSAGNSPKSSATRRKYLCQSSRCSQDNPFGQCHTSGGSESPGAVDLTLPLPWLQTSVTGCIQKTSIIFLCHDHHVDTVMGSICVELH